MSAPIVDSTTSSFEGIDLLDLDRWSREGAPHGWFTSLEQLLDRDEQVEVVGEVDRLRSNFLHGVEHLPVRFI